MAEETLLLALDQRHDTQSSPQVAVCGGASAFAQTDGDDDLDYPMPYSEEQAQRWASEDPHFDAETYRQDPYFTKENQAGLREAMERYKDGEYIRQTKINGEWVIVDVATCKTSRFCKSPEA